jgi:hypothetical protein
VVSFLQIFLPQLSMDYFSPHVCRIARQPHALCFDHFNTKTLELFFIIIQNGCELRKCYARKIKVKSSRKQTVVTAVSARYEHETITSATAECVINSSTRLLSLHATELSLTFGLLVSTDGMPPRSPDLTSAYFYP